MTSNFRYALLTILLLSLLLSGCATPHYVKKGEEFPAMYEEQPRALLVLPPINESTDAEAKAYYMTTVEEPFALMGYYVFPVEMVSDIMKQEGVYDTEVLYHVPMDKFRDYFGADAVLYTRIKLWNVAYAVLASNLTVSIEAEIVSTKTSRQLWKYTGTVVVDLSGGDTGGGFAGLIAKAIVTAVNTARADYVKYARVANLHLIYTLPAGPYNEMYQKDQEVKLVDQTPPAKP